MGNENPENYEPSSDDLADADRFFRDITSKDLPSDAESLDIDPARKSVDREHLAESRREMLDRLFGVSDLLEASPDFPERQAAQAALKATCRLLTSYYSRPEFRAKAAREALDLALSAVRKFDPSTNAEEMI